MRLFGYYACHACLNQIKKLFKTWVLVFFLICALIGGLIGFGAASIGGALEAQEPQQEQTEEALQQEQTEEELQQEQAEEELPMSMEEKMGITPMELTELIAGGIILAVLVFGAFSADKNGSKIFLPADVNLLFASPMKPQSVLLFRLTTQVGVAILGCFWLAIQIPNFMNMGMSLWAAVTVIFTWCISFTMALLVQTLLYTVCSTHQGLKKYIRQFIYGLLLLLGLGYFLYWKTTGSTYLQAACGFFNHPVTRYIPIWGWLKGFCVFSIEENAPAALISLAAIILGGVGLLYVILHMKADFYEDAMAKSQETAALMEAAQSEKTVIRKRKKDRSDKLRRDGMGHGWGANVFFCKSMYNRFRFAHFHVFTKTSETYLAAALGVAALCRFVFHVPGLMPVCLTLGGLSFFRALGNPLAQDTELDLFRMIPESTWSKLFWSLMGGTVNCLLDLIPGIAAAILLLGENPLEALGWIPLIVSVDFFSSAVGSFINLSVPVSAGKTIKQMVQIMFVYFGILPDVAIMAVGFVSHSVIGAALGATVLNVALGFAFLALLPLFIDPKDGKKPEEKRPFTGDLKQIRRRFSRLGLSVFLFLAVSSLIQILVSGLFPQWAVHPIGMWLCTFGPIYLVGLPVCLLCIRSVPAEKIPQKKMKAGHWCIAMLICAFLLVAGNYLGVFLQLLLNKLFGLAAVNPIEALAVNQPLLPKILVMVIIAPLVEEYVFRKQLIDRMHPYGGKLAVVTTAVLFGLFHGNLSQFFYACSLGLMFGYVYLKTGRLRYSVAMHMTVNFFGGVFAPWLLEHLDMAALDQMQVLEMLESALPWIVAFGAYTITMFAAAVAGLVLLCANHRKITFETASMELPDGKKFTTAYGNLGMILIILACLCLTVMTFLV